VFSADLELLRLCARVPEGRGDQELKKTLVLGDIVPLVEKVPQAEAVIQLDAELEQVSLK
jgi:hypothetical protein